MWMQTLFIYILSICLMGLGAMYVYFRYKYNYWAKKHVFYLEPRFPYGNTKSLLFLYECFGQIFYKIYNEIKEKSRSFGGFYMFAQPNLMLVDPDLIKNIMTKDFKHFQDTGMYLDEESDPIGAHLIALKGKKWKSSRAKLTPTFSSGKIKMMFGTIVKVTKELYTVINQHIEFNQSLDIKDIFARLSIDVIGSCAFGLDCNSLKNPNVEFRKYGQKIFEFDTRASIINFMAANFPSLLKLFKIPMVSPDISNFFMNIVKQSVEYREKNNVYRSDFLDLLIKLKNNQCISNNKQEKNTFVEGITMNELAAQVFVFFAAGFETTSSTINFCMYELANHFDIQDKLRQEVKYIIEKYGELTYDAIMDMKYMDKVISETLRKYPPIPMVRRECTEAYKIPNSDCTIDVGTIIVISMLGLHNDPEYFPDPEKFDPERFNDEQKASRHPFTYLPFGEGPRSCIGMRFGLMEAKIVLSMLLKDYKFSLDTKTILPVEFNAKSVFLSPANPFWLRAEKN